MSTKCTKQLTISEPDMPLDQAIYAPSPVDKIFAVRGGYIFQFNSTTGALEATERFAANFDSPASIAYDSGSQKLFASVWNDIKPVGGPVAMLNTRAIYVIDNITLATTGIFTYLDIFALPPQNLNNGPHAIICQGGALYCVLEFDTQPFPTRRLVKINITTGLVTYAAHSWVGGSANIAVVPTNDLCIDTYNNYIWECGPSDTCYGYTLTDLTWQTSHVKLEPVTENQLVGICFSEGYDKVYGVNRSDKLFEWDITVNMGVSNPTKTLYTIPHSASPSRLKFNDTDLFLYIADWDNNMVHVFDPGTGIFSTKTGFDSPCDFVFTPTKKFAVQKGARGLKEIT